MECYLESAWPPDAFFESFLRSVLQHVEKALMDVSILYVVVQPASQTASSHSWSRIERSDDRHWDASSPCVGKKLERVTYRFGREVRDYTAMPMNFEVWDVELQSVHFQSWAQQDAECRDSDDSVHGHADLIYR
jgi:hypothetical protein